MKDAEDDEDVDPRNVIADDQIVSIDADVIEGSLNFPPRWQHQIKDAIVAAAWLPVISVLLFNVARMLIVKLEELVVTCASY